MVIELRAKSQITLPKSIVSSLGISEGDKLEIFEKDGIICIVPVVVYPKKYLGELQDEIKQVKDNINNGKQPVFDNLEALFDKLDVEEHCIPDVPNKKNFRSNARRFGYFKR